MEPCNKTEGRLGIMNNSKDYLGINNDYFCPRNYSYQINGSFSGEIT